ncbi:hydantoinase/oxoprolinase family protein [Chloroflexota bacterium]
MNQKYYIGTDTGGTFTDIVAVTPGGDVFLTKAPTTPQDFSIGVMDAIEELANSLKIPRQDLLKNCQMFTHGTTVATNALINRVGSKVGLITTKGFEDTTLIMRAIGRVAGLSEDEIKHQVACTKPEPIVPKGLIKGVTERIDFEGKVIVPINMEEAREAIRSLVEDEGVEAIAVNFLFSFINPVHEKLIKELLQGMYGDKDVFCCFAHELCPVVREYARSNTVIINSFLGKTIERYLEGLNSKLTEAGYSHRLLIMEANGGVVDVAETSPVGTLSSGPAGGILACKHMSDILGHSNVITTDMGGTSFDVGLLIDGLWRYAREPIVERFHISWPMVDVISIGAGGGTIARVDPVLGRLLVGPDSAGADPGPVCYDIGGIEPTITDADLVLGYLNPNYFLGGKKRLNKQKAETVLRNKIASPLKMDIVEAAAGIYDVINAHMSDLVSKQVARAGYIPEQFVLYSFGGAGPVHAAAYAAEMGISKVYIFPSSAVFSAFGIATADIVHTYKFSYRYRMPAEPEVLNSKLAEIEGNLLKIMDREGIDHNNVQFRRICHMRYRRQLNEIDVSVPVKTYNIEDISDIMNRFDARYEEVYGEGTAYREAGQELISMTIDAIGKTPKPAVAKQPLRETSPIAALKGEREVFFTGKIRGFIKTKIYDYGRLLPGNILEGPSIIETAITTVLIPPGNYGEIDEYFNVIINI